MIIATASVAGDATYRLRIAGLLFWCSLIPARNTHDTFRPSKHTVAVQTCANVPVSRKPAHLAVPLFRDERLVPLDVSIEAHVGASDPDDVEAEPVRFTLHAGGQNPLVLVLTKVMIGKSDALVRHRVRPFDYGS